MKKMIIAALALVAGTTAAQAAPTFVSSWQVRGNGAQAGFFGGNDCSSTGFDIGANDNVVHSRANAPAQESGAWAGLWSYNWCTGEETYGWGYVPGSAVSLSLAGGTVSVSFDAYSYGWQFNADTGEFDYVFLGTKTVTAQVTWTGTGDAMRVMNQSMNRWGQFFARNRVNGQLRQASMSATIDVGGTPFAYDFSYGELAKYNAGAVEIFRY